MPSWNELENFWKTFKELDLRPIQAEAEQPLTLAFLGETGVGKSTLIAALSSHARTHEKVITPTIEADALDEATQSADLIVLVLDATQRDFLNQAQWYSDLKAAKRNVVVFYNKMDALVGASAGQEQNSSTVAISDLPWTYQRIAFGSAIDPDLLENDFIPRVLEALPAQHLALARRYPLFRFAVAQRLISDVAFANATYSLSTGLAEIVPALDIPFNVADIVILTKNQALMVYKLGLALGLSPFWKDQLAQLGGVIGAGFLWRQAARQLVGLIPGWGILPKVAIAYAGTFAVGEAVISWYKTGHKLSKEAMRQVYVDALARGKEIAQNLLSRAPRPSLSQMPRLGLPQGRPRIACVNCGGENAGDAKFCNNCGSALN